MPGKVVRILLREGAEVEAGTGILVVEAMKMQNEVKSPKKGRIQKIVVTRRRRGKRRRCAGRSSSKRKTTSSRSPLLSRMLFA